MGSVATAVRIGVGSSSGQEAAGGAREAALAARAGVGTGHADLVIVFATHRDPGAPARILEAVRDVLPARSLGGCASRSVVSGPGELPRDNSVVVWAANFAGGEAQTFHLGAPIAEPLFPDLSGSSGVLLFHDPYTYPIDDVLPQLAAAAPGVPMIGGSASGRTRDGETVLFADDQVLRSGMICVTLEGIELIPVVAEASFPVGPELQVTAADRHVIHEIGGRPAAQVLQSALAQAGPAEQALIDGGVNLGLAEGGGARWAMRKILHVDAELGTVAVGATVERGSAVRLLANSSAIAKRRLQDRLAEVRVALGGDAPAGALLASCVGRSAEFLGSSGYDAAVLAATLETDAVAGFASLAELGPAAGAVRRLARTAVVGVFP